MKKYKLTEITFLEYQALTYKTIGNVINEYPRDSLSENDITAIRTNLLNLWVYQDHLIFELEGPPYLDTHYKKLELIGKYLAEEYGEEGNT